MRSYSSNNFSADRPCVCALGCFDGVHLGHSALIKEAHSVAIRLSLPVAVWSFAEPPKNHFLRNKVGVLTLPDEKKPIMKRLGVDSFVSVPLSDEIFSLSPEDFFYSILIEGMQARHIVCGFNYRFGRGGAGDVELLQQLCAKNGVGISVVPPVKLGDIIVSSSEIRAALTDGNVELANKMLGHPYSLRAKVSDGQRLGRQLGFPTINQSFPARKLLPKNGVYLSEITVGRIKRYGITNVGTRPTVDGATLCAETNIFDFCGDLYKKTVTVEILGFIRPECKFSSVEELKDRVHKDISIAKEMIKK